MKRLDELFQIKNGNDLELCYQHKNEDGINFVSRTENNNGVSARIEEIEGLEPWDSGTISVSLGGSVLEAFVQTEPYYTGYHMRVLIPIVPMDEITKQYYCMCIRANKFKYGYGIQANKTIDALLVPDIDEIPIWVSKIKPGKHLTKAEQHEGETFFVGATKFNNGLTGYIDAEPLYSEPCIT